MSKRIAIMASLFLFMFASVASASHGVTMPGKKAIVLTAFGTSYPDALQSILNVKKKVEEANPGIPVKLAFTSSMIRHIWQERQTDEQWQKENPGIPAEVLYVQNTLATIANLQNTGYGDIAVQSLHVFAGEEFHDTMLIVNGFRSMRTMKARHSHFKRIVLGRPALGLPGEAYPYTDDIQKAVQTLAGDVSEARSMGAALVYMGHGNDFFSTGIYAEFQKAMQQHYDYPVIVGAVEGFPAFDDVLADVKASGKKKILMKPFMIVAGDHASNDMDGDEDDSWKVMLTKEGFTVKTEMRGLGMVDGWAQIYVDHLKDAMTPRKHGH